jgi:hypothetical protein
VSNDAQSQAVKAIALILCIDAMPDDENPEVVQLCSGSRSQLEAALEAAGETGIWALDHVRKARERYGRA